MKSTDPTLAARKFIARRSSVEALASSRALTFGGAGASLATILLIAQIGLTKAGVVWSLGFAAAAFPLWLSLALTYDIWLAFKLDFDDLYASKWLPQVQASWFCVTGITSFLSIACLVYSLHSTSGIIFIGMSVVGLLLVAAGIFAAAYRLHLHMVGTAGHIGKSGEA